MTDPQFEARDPNTSPKRLAELLYGFTDDVLKNPALPLIVLENPGWLDGIDTERHRTLLNKPELPLYLVKSLEQSTYGPIAVNAKMHVALGTEITDWDPLLKNLALLNCSREDRLALEQHELIPQWLLAHLPPLPAAKAKRVPIEPLVPLTDQEAEVIRNRPERERESLARTTPAAAILHVLARDSSKQVQQRVARNSHTSQEDLRYLKKFDYCLVSIAENPATSTEILSQLANFGSLFSYKRLPDCIAMNPNCTAELAQQLRKSVVSEESWGRFYTAEELVKLFEEGKTWAAEEAKRRADTPQWLVAEGLMLDIQKRRAFMAWFCGLLATDNQKRLTKNLRSGNWFTRFAIAINPNTKPRALEKLAMDANRYVRFAAQARLQESGWSLGKELGYG